MDESKREEAPFQQQNEEEVAEEERPIYRPLTIDLTRFKISIVPVGTKREVSCHQLKGTIQGKSLLDPPCRYRDTVPLCAYMGTQHFKF